jgi:flagellar biosynthetic protein FliR
MTLGLPLSTMIAFLLVLARVAGLVGFLPVPGFKSAPALIRIVLAVAISISLFPLWPSMPDELPSFGKLAGWAFAEMGFGMVVGLAVSFLVEAFQIGAQALSLQAGYSYASTIDPSTQADSGVLQVVMTLMTGLLFFTSGMHRELIRLLAASFQKFPAGTWTPSAASLNGILHLGSEMFSLGLRIAMPVIALLLLIDLSLAFLGRMQQQLQLLTLAFPIKMLAALAILVALSPVLVRIFQSAAARTLAAIAQVAP